MLWFKLVVTFTVLIGTSGSLIQKSEIVASYVKKLILSHGSKDNNTNDVTIVRVNGFKNSVTNVRDLYDEVMRTFSTSVVVLSPPLNKVIGGPDLRPASFIIIVSDILNSVSQFILNYICFINNFSCFH